MNLDDRLRGAHKKRLTQAEAEFSAAGRPPFAGKGRRRPAQVLVVAAACIVLVVAGLTLANMRRGSGDVGLRVATEPVNSTAINDGGDSEGGDRSDRGGRNGVDASDPIVGDPVPTSTPTPSSIPTATVTATPTTTADRRAPMPTATATIPASAGGTPTPTSASPVESGPTVAPLETTPASTTTVPNSAGSANSSASPTATPTSVPLPTASTAPTATPTTAPTPTPIPTATAAPTATATAAATATPTATPNPTPTVTSTPGPTYDPGVINAVCPSGLRAPLEAASLRYVGVNQGWGRLDDLVDEQDGPYYFETWEPGYPLLVTVEVVLPRPVQATEIRIAQDPFTEVEGVVDISTSSETFSLTMSGVDGWQVHSFATPTSVDRFTITRDQPTENVMEVLVCVAPAAQ